MRIAAGVTPSLMNSTTAAPPRIAKIGAPSAPPSTTSATPGQGDRPSSSAGSRRRRRRRASPQRRRPARPLHCGLARHTSRSAIRTKPIGSTSCAIQVGMPAPIVEPTSRSDRTSSTAATGQHDRHRRRRAPPANIAAARRGQPAGTNVPVASDSSLPSRAAIAAPRKPTQSDEMLNDGTGGRARRRRARAATTISSSGRTTMIASASDGDQVFERGERRASPGRAGCASAVGMRRAP